MQNGDLVLACWGGEAPVCKILHGLPERIELHSANPNYPVLLPPPDAEVELFAIIDVVRQLVAGGDVVFALVDGNNFYASCEQVFQPHLRAKPLVVLSNNDGCAIARCAQAKALGIAMGQPAHQLREYVQRFGLQMRSANFGLYGDMSARVVRYLREFSRRIEVYSIDESFLDLSGIRERREFGQDIRFSVKQWTGIPCCIGIGPTKTLAKLANKWAKKNGGVIDISESIDARQDIAAVSG